MKAFLLVCLAIAVKAEADPQILLNQPLLHKQIIGSPFYSSPIISSPIISSALPVTSYIAGKPIVQLAEQKPVQEKKVEIEVESYSAEKPQEKKMEIPTVYATQQVAGYPWASPIAYNTPLAYAPLKVAIAPKYHAKNGEVEHTVYKREADAQVMYANQWASPIIAPSVYSGLVHPAAYSSVVAKPAVYSAAYPAVYSAAHPAVYAAPGMNVQGVNAEGKTVNKNVNPWAFKGYSADSVGAQHVVKREADAQQYIASPLAYGNAWTMPLAYNQWASPIAYNAALPWAATSKTIADDRFNGRNYGAKGQHVAVTAGTIHLAKREAEADAQTVYSTLGYNYVTPSVYSSYRPSVYSSVYRPSVYSSSLYRPVAGTYSGLYY